MPYFHIRMCHALILIIILIYAIIVLFVNITHKGQVSAMRDAIHPVYHQVLFFDVTSGYKFLSGSTKSSNEKMEWEDGNSYPVIRVDTSSASHPFYTGKQRISDKGGRVDRFNQRVQQMK